MSVSTTITLPIGLVLLMSKGLFWFNIVPFTDCGILGALGAAPPPPPPDVLEDLY